MTTTNITIPKTYTAIDGDTYPVRDKLKNLGCKWDAGRKMWYAPPDRAGEARAIVSDALKEGAKKPLSKTDMMAIAARKRGVTPGECATCGKKCKHPYIECWDCREERMMGY